MVCKSLDKYICPGKDNVHLCTVHWLIETVKSLETWMHLDIVSLRKPNR